MTGSAAAAPGSNPAVTPSYPAAKMPSMKVYEGQLNKFTNVVKGWQYRWFVLTPETGQLDYYLMDEGIIGKLRGRQYVAGTVVIPSDEDSQTFHVNFSSGESYKLRAANVRDRQVWVDRIRAVAHRHDNALAKDSHQAIHKEYVTPPAGSKSLLTSNGEPSAALQNLSLSVLDAFGSVHDILQQSDLKHAGLTKAIEALPFHQQGGGGVPSVQALDQGLPGCHDEDLLVLKATSQAALASMESALNILQDLRDLQIKNQNQARKMMPALLPSPMAISPKKSSSSFMRASNPDLTTPTGSPPVMMGASAASKAQLELSMIQDTLSVKSANPDLAGSQSPTYLSKTNLSTSTPHINEQS